MTNKLYKILCLPVALVILLATTIYRQWRAAHLPRAVQKAVAEPKQALI